MDRHTPEQRKKNMQTIKNSGSKIEKTLEKELWSRGLRYRKNVKSVIGKPDIVFLGDKIAVFCDCEFPYKSRIMRTIEPLKPLKAPYMARNPVK